MLLLLTTTKLITTATPMAPSTRLAASRVAVDDGNVLRDMPVPRPDEPNLFSFPSTIHPTYQPLPLVTRAIVGSISIMLALRTTWTRRLTWLQPLVAIKHADLNITKLLLFLGKGLIIYASTNFVLQDVWTPPSRITTRALRDDYWLPSVLSTYDDSSGVHHLSHHFHHQSVLQPAQFQAMHMNHGFGASALSWLPVLPKLAERLKVRYSVAHDAPGFGFTDRSTNGDYTSEANAEIGIQLLRDKIALEDERPVVLMGHSMGALATLHMATKLPETTKLLIVLVSPALGLRRYKSSSQEKSKRKVTSKETSHGGFLDPVIQYVLKRAVGSKDFWKRGLRFAWGDPNRVSDSDALRFQWPSIGQGWEQGLLRFSRAQMTMNVDERGLFQHVLNRPNTRLVVMRGNKDGVVTKAMLDTFLVPFPGVQVIELDGLGHDPFEEDAELFISTLEGWCTV